ncbi:MAG: AraC family transcriptional regulator [Pseudomonadota bacterium]
MSLVNKAAWYIEWRRCEPFTLDDVAQRCGVSRFHLARVFQAVTGKSPMAYARGRRLSEAARALAGGADDVLTVALDAGYSSHEAFTRAFREQFELTPAAVRAAQSTEHLRLVEPLAMDDSLLVDLQPPRFERRPAFHVVGLSERCTFDTNHTIPALWRRFAPHIGRIPGQLGSTAYGICYGSDGEGAFDYMAGVEVGQPDTPPDLVALTVPAQRYAVFTHAGHISDIRKTTYTIWNKWLPESEVSPSGGPDFERYDERFDPDAGMGQVEIWIPLAQLDDIDISDVVMTV